MCPMTVPRALSNNSLIKVVNRPKKYEYLMAFSAPLGVAYRPRKILSDGLKTKSSYLLSSYLSKVQRVPFESPAQGLSHGTLKSDLGLKMASAEAKNMKKWTFFKLVWSKGQLAFEGQM